MFLNTYQITVIYCIYQQNWSPKTSFEGEGMVVKLQSISYAYKKEETDKLRNKTSPAKNEFLLIKTLVTEQGNGILTDDKGPYSWLT